MKISYQNIKKAKAIEAENRKRLLKLNPDLNNHGGIYFLTREEDGFKYAYIGQSKEWVFDDVAEVEITVGGM